MKKINALFFLGIIMLSTLNAQETVEETNQQKISETANQTLNILPPNESIINCDLECYWKIEGNQNIDDDLHFIGPLNGEDFLVKTGDLSQGLNTERIRVDEEGRVAIGRGTNIQSSIFQINNYTNSLHQPGFRFDFDDHQPYLRMDQASGINPHEVFSWQIKNITNNENQIWGALQFSSTNGKQLLNHENYDPKVTILQNGFVGLGIEKPSERLSVNGNAEFNGIVYATELIVDEAEEFWPDYVFEDDYQLMSLTEVEKFINENGHLPNIPSAKEIGENGINISKMQIKMMEKIEELTLQLIELEKKNTRLENELKSLMK